ncbi:hypothetical protein GW17_00034704 [Ensete ventricosum]|nr:hypothetical protein GW17_00034704 [Ensete ventricosum]RZR99452.1 hypothetical protein BHM03_00029004 [Ensete ventricosum]
MLSSPPPAPPPPPGGTNGTGNKKKRRPAGTPDPDADVVALSPRTLLESDRYVCEICQQGFQRDQNLQMHRRRHKVPWKLLKRDAAASEVRKRVFVCPETTCLHHDPRHALGDLVGIKKHFRRKHSSHRQWACAKCSKAYAVQSDYKAHLKTCGTRGHSCDCGRMNQAPPCVSRTATNTTPSSWPGLGMPSPAAAVFLTRPGHSPSSQPVRRCTENIELPLLPTSNNQHTTRPSSVLSSPASEEAEVTKLQLSLGPADDHTPAKDAQAATARLKDEVMERLKLAMAEKALADDARQQARRQLELAEHEIERARRIRQQAQLELNRAHAIREHAVKQISSAVVQITCHACKQQFQQAKPAMAFEENSFAISYMSSAVTEGEEENDDRNHQRKIPKL